MKEVEITYAHTDFEVVNGSGNYEITIDTNARYNGSIQNNIEALNDQIKYTRYFPKSGTYKVRFVYITTLSSGTTDLGFDSISGNNLFDGIDQQSSGSFNNIKETIIQISRGFHVISILNEAQGGAGDFRFPFQFIQFDLIAEHEIQDQAGIPNKSGEVSELKLKDITTKDVYNIFFDAGILKYEKVEER